LKKDDTFGYWFDFGDDWWHQINVIAIDEKPGRGKYPKGPGQKYFAGLGVKLSLDSDAMIERNRSPFREPLRISRLRRVRRV